MIISAPAAVVPAEASYSSTPIPVAMPTVGQQLANILQQMTDPPTPEPCRRMQYLRVVHQLNNQVFNSEIQRCPNGHGPGPGDCQSDDLMYFLISICSM